MEISQLLDKPIAYHRIYAEVAGDVLAGVMLSQAIYWSNRTDDPDGWFYKVQEEWYEETALTRKNQETARKILGNLCDEQGNKVWHERRKDIPAKLYYRIDHKVLTALILKSAAQMKQYPKYPNKTAQIGQTVDSKGTAQIAQIGPTGLHDSSQQDGSKRALYSEITTQRVQAESLLGEVSPMTPLGTSFTKLHEVPAGDAQLGTDGALLCKCGDNRSDHPNDGECNLNGLGHGIPSNEPENICHAYRPEREIVHNVVIDDEQPPAPLPDPSLTPKKPAKGRKTQKTAKSGDSDPRVKPLLDYLVEKTGQPIVVYGKQGTAVKSILKAGFTPEQAKEVLDYQLTENWRSTVSWNSVQNQISDYFRRKQQTAGAKSNGTTTNRDEFDFLKPRKVTLASFGYVTDDSRQDSVR